MNELTPDQVLEAYRDAIDQVFGSEIEGKSIEEGTFTGQDDPAEWAPDALVVIHTEDGIPNPIFDVDTMDTWFRVDEVTSEMVGQPVFSEPVNGAVLAVYAA